MNGFANLPKIELNVQGTPQNSSCMLSYKDIDECFEYNKEHPPMSSDCPKTMVEVTLQSQSFGILSRLGHSFSLVLQ